MPQTVSEYLEEVRGTTSGRLSPFIHPFMHFSWVGFYFRNVVSEKKSGIQIESKDKSLKLGIKVSEKDMWSGQGKEPTRGGCPAGLTGHPRLPAAASSTLAL